MIKKSSICKLSIITILTLLSGFFSPAFPQDTTTLNTAVIERFLLEKVPTGIREESPQQYIHELVDDFNSINIYTVEEANVFIDIYMQETLELEKEISQQITEILNNTPDFKSQLENDDCYLTAHVFTGQYCANGEEVEIALIKQGIFFTPLGLVCTMIDLHKKHDKGDFVLPVYYQDKMPLDLPAVEEILAKKISTENREESPQHNVHNLIDYLQEINIHNVGNAKAFIDTYMKQVLDLEKEICSKLIDIIDNTSDLKGKLESDPYYLTADVITGSYVSDGSDSEIALIKQGIFFTPIGLVCTMVDLHKKQDKGDFFIPVYGQNKTPLDRAILEKILESKIPIKDREGDPQQCIPNLIYFFQEIEINNAEEASVFIDIYLEQVLDLEDEICTKLNKLIDITPDLKATIEKVPYYLSADTSIGSYLSDGNDKQITLIKQGIFFTAEELVCNIIDLYMKMDDEVNRCH